MALTACGFTFEDSDYEEEDGFEGDEEEFEEEFEEEESEEEETQDYDGEQYDPTSEGAPSIEWHVGQGTNGEEHVHEGIQTSDGGYIAIGHTQEASSSKSDILIVKVDEDGELEWQQVIGTAGQWDVGIAIAEVDDGFIAGGIAVNNTP